MRSGTKHETRTALTCVQEEVILQVRLLGEASGADVTLERPGPVVDVHVRLEITRRREGLGAEAAFVWFVLYGAKEEWEEREKKTT